MDVVKTTNPWESTTCRCGSVTVSGVPWRPRVTWLADVPGGWSYVEPCSESSTESCVEESGGEPGDCRRIGF